MIQLFLTVLAADQVYQDVENAEAEEHCIPVKYADLLGLNMGKVVVNIKALPKDTSADIDKLVTDIKQFLSKYGSVYKTDVQPLAFGLTVIMITIVIEEEEGTSKVEEAFKSFGDASLSISEVSRAPDF